MLLTLAVVKPVTSWSPVGRASNCTTEAGDWLKGLKDIAHAIIINVLLNRSTSTNILKIFHFMILSANDMYRHVCYDKLCKYDVSYIFFYDNFLKPQQLCHLKTFTAIHKIKILDSMIYLD